MVILTLAFAGGRQQALHNFRARPLLIVAVGGYNYPLLLDHISREAEYFIKIMEKAERGEKDMPLDSIVQENVFWLRIMADHARFIRGLLDPSERGFVEKAQAFGEEFERLLAQARDIEGFLWDSQNKIPTLVRFERSLTEATGRIRDFKQQAKQLIEDCAVLSLIPVALADHVRREAEHFLGILALIEQKLS